MQATKAFFLVLSALAVMLPGCDGKQVLDPPMEHEELSPAGKPGEIAVLTKLPSLGGNADALGVNESGTVVVGLNFDGSGLHAVKWTLQNGSWTITTLPYPSSARAEDINNAGDAAGSSETGPDRAVLWPAGGGSVDLGCASDVGQTRASAISAAAQVVVGIGNRRGAVWRPGSCRESLPALVPDSFSSAHSVNGNGTIVGGSAASSSSGGSVPVRWREIAGQWQIEQLDSRIGVALGANPTGDLAGYVNTCGLPGCNRAVIWYATGGSRELGTLGGVESSAHDMNAAGEVVGNSTARRFNTAFFWSESTGMLKLPTKARWAAAWAVSEVRPDGTRLVVGSQPGGGGQQAVVWVVRNP